MQQLIELMAQNNALWLSTALVFGLVVGSFLNVVIHRTPVLLKRQWREDCAELVPDAPAYDDGYPKRYNLVTPNSTCPKCGHAIKAWQNIPVISWLLLKGKCANCQTPISKRYPIVETITGLMIVAVAHAFGPTWTFLFAALFTFTLIALTGIDLDEMLLPDNMTLPLLWLGLIVNVSGTFVPLQDAVIGAAAGYLSLWSVFWLFKLVTGKEGMGYGDFKLLAAAGAWLGWQMLPMIILLSSLIGAIVGISLMAFKKLQQGNPIPFGPYIAGAAWVAMLWGESIWHWYLSML
ncbi:prepilin peptidase [Paraferrimonas sedimenticola]|uniref:Prepilin leader peptidase/N-methyltransferase n=1 Tax=Paraferrimonas sedimenticola TaxID=375674 RepID=A0AA37VZ69_9GAMM|nr:A24 family peptidase [Paraferrimonas sedimenticola]GLP97466.1 type 4 prepilin-like proteins leader peptide-processing enzyme [Paraferrimonas sedimenticola]